MDYGFWEDLQTFHPLELSKRISCKVMLVHGSDDKVVPVEHSRVFAKALGIDPIIVQGAGHGYNKPEENKQMRQAILSFVKENLL